jgi:CRISPR-associated endonuclease/helicase Cas3
VNTKRDALAIYAEWKEQFKTLEETMDAGCLVHLSTHMCPAHRLEALNSMKASLNPQTGKHVLCVSTQLIEAGVDIDFATVVRDLAGLDSIAQAAGRCNRNGERAIGRVHIIKMAQELPRQLGEIRCAQENARRVLNGWREDEGERPFELSDPRQMEQFFKYHFFARANLMDYPVGSPLALRDDTLLQMLGENSMAVYDAKIKGVTRNGLMQSFHTAAQAFQAIDCQTQGVVVPFRKEGKDLIAELSAAHDLALEFRLLRRAQMFSVNVFQHEMECLKRNDAVYEAQRGTGVLCLREGFYSDEFGLALDGSERMESLIA